MPRQSNINPIDKYVGERLRLARTVRGLSQSYLGSCIGVTFQQIQKYENAKTRISASTLAWFSRLLGVPVQYFYDGMPAEYHNGGSLVGSSDERPLIPSDIMLRRETVTLVEHYYAISDGRRRDALIDFIKILADGKNEHA